ncbi:hypothetical protein WG907_05480 [Sphingobium sp. AN558]|uniref:hypothetical protein n=1 Tax=Sphingobium sp. AN558 TaxID=3133442 RepID=UPI0030C18E07
MGDERVDDAAVDRWSCRAAAWLPIGLGVLLAIALVGVMIDPVHDKRQFSAFLFVRQDLVFALAIALLIRFGLKPGTATRAAWMDGVARRPWVIALLLALAAWAGHYLLLQGHDLTRDEQMATFDAAIYAHGHLSWPIAPAWRPVAEALNQFFILPIAGRQAWVSSYLPVNALARAAMGTLGDASLASPLFTAIGALALWRIALRLWPDDSAARAVALLLYAGSSQIVIQGMTAHAMAGHLALDLVWLALFLRDRRSSHAGAIIVGFLATGLHQPLFHPLFALPFLIGLIVRRRWSLALGYGAAYCAIGLFWLAWPNMIAQLSGGALETLSETGDRLGYLDRLLFLLRGIGPVSLWLMAMNLLRFVAWQHLLLLPLAAAGMSLGWRSCAVRPLVAGIVLHIVVVGLLLAFQGHGWGYRYLHGVVGSFCLLGAQGWHALRGRWPGERLWAWGNGVTFLLMLPAHMAMTAWLTLPYAQVSERIDRLPVDVAIVDNGAVAYGSDLVFNRPDLSNRPIRLLAGSLTPAQAATLCRTHEVAFVDSTMLQPIRQMIDAKPGPKGPFNALRAACDTRQQATRP